MGKIEQPNDNGPSEHITNLASLKEKLGILNKKELSPENERIKVLANSLEQLADLNKTVRKDHEPNMIFANPPIYELLT
ncbi:MAG: hypothetical protein O3A80_04875 [bacterium]|nr:hypothetical protein [bacterium]MDA1292602.1 hypothetical protein [bacterium]